MKLKEYIQLEIKKQLNEAKKKKKKYNEVEIGDIAYEHPDSGGRSQMGKVLWKGKSSDLKISKYKKIIDPNDTYQKNIIDNDEDLIVVDVKSWGPTIMQYDEVEGCICYS